jgi:hypothetical protein
LLQYGFSDNMIGIANLALKKDDDEEDDDE